MVTDPEPDVGKGNSGHGAEEGQKQKVTVSEDLREFTLKRRGGVSLIHSRLWIQLTW